MSAFRPLMTTGSSMPAARFMKSNIKLKITSDLGRANMDERLFSGIRHPFGSIKKNENASLGMRPIISGMTVRKSAEYVLIAMSGYFGAICANLSYASAERSTRNADIFTSRHAFSTMLSRDVVRSAQYRTTCLQTTR